MLSPLKPLLCRHDFYWSERHLSDRCRRCGKLRAADEVGRTAGRALLSGAPARVESDRSTELVQSWRKPELHAAPRPARLPELTRPGAKVLRAQASERRDQLPELLERLIGGERPTRGEAIDAVLAVMEDAHSANPVLFGPGAAGHFARLLEARRQIANPAASGQ